MLEAFDAVLLARIQFAFAVVAVEPRLPLHAGGVAPRRMGRRCQQLVGQQEAAGLWAAYLASKEVQRDAPAPARISVLGDPELQKTRIHYKATLDALSGKLALFPNVPQSAQIITYLYKD